MAAGGMQASMGEARSVQMVVGTRNVAASSSGPSSRTDPGSPYANIRELERTVESLRGWRADMTRAPSIAGVPVVLARGVLARTVAAPE